MSRCRNLGRLRARILANQSGMSLIQVMVASGLLSIALLGSTAFMAYVAKTNHMRRIVRARDLITTRFAAIAAMPATLRYAAANAGANPGLMDCIRCSDTTGGDNSCSGDGLDCTSPSTPAAYGSPNPLTLYYPRPDLSPALQISGPSQGANSVKYDINGKPGGPAALAADGTVNPLCAGANPPAVTCPFEVWTVWIPHCPARPDLLPDIPPQGVAGCDAAETIEIRYMIRVRDGALAASHGAAVNDTGIIKSGDGVVYSSVQRATNPPLETAGTLSTNMCERLNICTVWGIGCPGPPLSPPCP